MNNYKVLGIMSGSSMDGVDLAHFTFGHENGQWNYEINAADTIPFSETWRVRLSQLRKQSALNYVKTDIFFGYYLGELTNKFLSDNNLEVDLISSHGHTAFHFPEGGVTAQVGDGESLSAITGIPSVTNFRRMDVAKGGQGAPLVTIGDDLLFNEYDFCLNLGGFANVSTRTDNKRVGYDICASNILLNRIARDLGQSYDKDGEIAERGSIDYELLGQLNAIEYYSKPYPKSLNRDWINKELWHIVRAARDTSLEDRMKTLVDHIATQIGNDIEDLSQGDSSGKKVLATGGGAFNLALMDHLKSHTDAELIVPDNNLIQYKESLVFGLMGLMRVLNQNNVNAEGTGAKSSSIAGSLHGDYSKIQ
jgi:anhydro-N-acetylmuramic acid kinase